MKSFPIDQFCVTAVDLIMDQGLQYNSQLQYCNNQLTLDLLKYHLDLYNLLSSDVSYLDVGNGCGMLQWINNEEGNRVDLVGGDTKGCNDSEFFSRLRYELRVENKYKVSEYFSKGLEITPERYWDYLLFIRFGPLQQARAKDLRSITKFFEQAKKYGKHSIISKVLLNENVKQYIIDNMKYEENYMAYIVRN